MAARRSTKKGSRRRPSRRDVPSAAWFLAAVAIIAVSLLWRADEPERTTGPREVSSPTITSTAEPAEDSPPTRPIPAAPDEVPAPAPPAAEAPAETAGTGSSTGTTGSPILPDDQRQTLAVQIALVRRGISPGPLDGRMGSQTRSAIRAFQFQQMIEATGEPDEVTLEALAPSNEVLEAYAITVADIASLGVVPDTWLGKSEVDSLPYTSMLELVAERAHSFQTLIRQLNPAVDWNAVRHGDRVLVPAVRMPEVDQRATLIRIKLAEKVLMALDDSGRLLGQFPCSIARRVEKRPEGVLRVKNFSESPNYRFDPKIFPESEEARRIGRVLIIPAGPNNPVGTAWIGLDLPGYGIHGTPDPEKVGRTESHGCFRLANWNANHLVKLVRVGMPVFVEP